MYEVIAEFVDKRDGSRVLPGQPCPKGMPADALARLVRAKCLKPMPAQAGLLGDVSGKGKTRGKGDKKAATKEAAPEGGQAQAGFLPLEDGSGAETLAGGDGGDPGERAEPDGGGRGKSEGQG